MSAPRLTERARGILEERARRLARPIAAADAGQSVDLVMLAAGRERYGIEIRYVLEVMQRVSVTPVPGTPGIVAGVVNRRGTILPVFDLRGLFDLAAEARPRETSVVVLGTDRAEFGLLADTGTEIVSVAVAEIAADAPFAGGKGQEFVRGATRSGAVVLDGATLLQDRRLFVGSLEDAKNDIDVGG